MGSHQSARMKNDEWLTPRWIVEPLGHFDLDPASPANPVFRIADRYYHKKLDGLSQPWGGRVWLNPPFGAEWPRWVERLADHGNGIALLAARTETDAFFRLVWGRADAICFVRGRPHFISSERRVLERRNKPPILLKRGDEAPFNSGAPICLVAYGMANADCIFESKLGKTLTIR